jgi:predicted Zn-dependent protease
LRLRRWLALPAALALCCALGFAGVRAVQAERHFTQVQAWANSDALQSFLAANEAYKAMPLEGRYRAQLAISLESLVVTDKRARLTDVAADRVAVIAASVSPTHPALLVARAQYLLNSGRWKQSDEILRIESVLRNSAKTYPQTWMLIAYRSAMAGETDVAVEALMTGLRVGGSLHEMRRVANAINMEIEEQ